MDLHVLKVASGDQQRFMSARIQSTSVRTLHSWFKLFHGLHDFAQILVVESMPQDAIFIASFRTITLILAVKINIK